jgi:hypothetical protein
LLLPLSYSPSALCFETILSTAWEIESFMPVQNSKERRGF